MTDKLEFYDAKSKKKFFSSNWRFEIVSSRDEKIKYFAVAEVPGGDSDAWRPVKTSFAQDYLRSNPELAGTHIYTLLLGFSSSSVVDLIERVESGFSYRTFDNLTHVLSSSALELSDWLRIPSRTLNRRKSTGELSSEESERVLRMTRVVQASFDLFEGDRDAANDWLRRPNRGLGGESPLNMSRTEIGGEEVLNLIGRLERGISS